MALALTITVLSVFYNTTTQRDSFENSWELQSSAGNLRSKYGLSSGSSERVRIIGADILGKLRNGTFETVIHIIESLAREKEGLIETERLTFKEGLWMGEIVSKLPLTNASTFTTETRQKIDENGRDVKIQTSIREFTLSPDTTHDEHYSTIKTFLSEGFEEEKETPEPVIQLMSVFPILITGLVWVAEELIVEVPLCFVSLGVVMVVKRVIFPLWKKELRKQV